MHCLERLKKNDKGRAERRNENVLTKKQQELQDLKILALKEQNLSNRAIGRQLSISETKVRNILKK